MLLYNLHIGAASIHLLSCIFAIIVHTDTITGKLTLPHHKYMSDPTATVRGLIVNSTLTHEVVLYTNPMIWIAANEALTFFSHVIALVTLKNLQECTIPVFERNRRTVEYMLTAGILQVALCLGTGAIALYDMFMLLIVNGVLQGLGWIYDQEDLPKRLKGYILTAAFTLLVVEIQYVIFQTTNLEGIGVTPYILMGVFYAIFYLMFGIVKLVPEWKEHEKEIYILMSVSSKVALSWILIGNTYEGLKELGVTSEPLDHTGLDWRGIQIGISVVCAVVLSVGIYLITRTNTKERQTRFIMVHLSEVEKGRKEPMRLNNGRNERRVHTRSKTSGF